MSSTPTLQIRTNDRIRILEIDHPPVNALSHPVRSALQDAVLDAEADVGIDAIVIRGSGTQFVAGADVREFDADPKPPLLNDVLLRIEGCRKPVVAAVRGAAMGGGFELALACHFRCVAHDAQFAFPEVKLGLLPGAGGTQRLPRLVGVETAIELMLSGDTLKLDKAQQLGIVDRLTEVDRFESAAIACARQLVQAGAPPARLSERVIDATQFPADFWATQLRKASELARGHGPHEHIVRAVQTGVTAGFAAGLAAARQSFEELRVGTPARALRHLFFAERGGKVAGAARVVKKVGVIGSGTMGSGIAISLATAGYEVILLDTKPEALAAGMKRLAETIDGTVKKGRLTSELGAAAIARVSAAGEYTALAQADLVIEAVFESMAVKREVFGALDAVCRSGAVLATNTSTLDVDAIAAATRRPADVLGMHFFSPANIMRLVEVVRGKASSADALATALAVTRRMGKLGILVGNCFGFVGNRMLYAYGRENQSMLLEGASPQQIDGALKKFGMAMGPHAVGDLAGLDVGYRARRERTDLPPDPRYYRVADLLVEAGRLGQKTAKGMYLYAPGSRDPVPDPEVDALIAAESARLGIARRAFNDAEIVERGMYALANEGARILQEGIAASAGDIDAIWCNGYGYPRWRGGPMFYADSVGLTAVKRKIEEFGARPGFDYWQVAPLLAQLAKDGRRFADWKP